MRVFAGSSSPRNRRGSWPLPSRRSSRCAPPSSATSPSRMFGLPADAQLPEARGRAHRSRASTRRATASAGESSVPLATATDRRWSMRRTGDGVQPADRRVPAHPAEARRHGGGDRTGATARPAAGAAEGRRRPATGSDLGPAKLSNTRTAIAIAREARTILGGNGVSGKYSPLRHAANLESVRTYEGTDEVHTLGAGSTHHGHLRLPDHHHRGSIMTTTALRHLIDGSWIEGTGDRMVDVNPSRPDDIVAEGAGASAADVDRAYRAARAALDGWRRTPARGRAAVLLRAANVIATIETNGGESWRGRRARPSSRRSARWGMPRTSSASTHRKWSVRPVRCSNHRRRGSGSSSSGGPSAS